MQAPPLPDDEAQRLQALRRCALLDTPADARFDRLTRLAQQLFDMPIALVSLVDADRVWFKSCQGLALRETGRDVSFCGHAILGPDIFEVGDTCRDMRFVDNPLVSGPPGIRFYAGAPLRSVDGYRIGTLGIAADRPRRLTPQQRQALRDLADCAEDEINRADATRMQAHGDSDHRLRAIIEGTNIGTWEWDIQSGATVFNERWAAIVGYTLAELEPVSIQTWLDLVHPEDRIKSDALLQRHFAGELDYYDLQCRMRHKQGYWVWVLNRGRVVRWSADGKALLMSGTHADISAYKQAEIALRDQAQHTQAILDNMVDGIITIDRNGLIDSFNPAAERIFGYTATEVLGRNVKLLMPNPDRDAHDRYLRNYQAGGAARIIGSGREIEGRRKDGSLFPMELAVSEISRQDQSMYIGMVRDITERKRVERLKREFVSTVSHELRTPLTAIAGALGLVAGGTVGPLPPRAGQMIDIARKNCERLTLLINDLLDIEKLAAGKMHFDMQPRALMPVIEHALEVNRGYGAQRRVRLELSAGLPGAVVRVDSPRLLQVMSNLLSNAIKYSPEAGTVSVAVTAHGDRVRVSVRDDGPGVPAAFHERIFQKFAQADASDSRQKGGTGLGLAISRELMERMGGRIGFESQEGRGACFFFELPRCDDTPGLC